MGQRVTFGPFLVGVVASLFLSSAASAQDFVKKAYVRSNWQAMFRLTPNDAFTGSDDGTSKFRWKFIKVVPAPSPDPHGFIQSVQDPSKCLAPANQQANGLIQIVLCRRDVGNPLVDTDAVNLQRWKAAFAESWAGITWNTLTNRNTNLCLGQIGWPISPLVQKDCVTSGQTVRWGFFHIGLSRWTSDPWEI